MLNRFVTFFEMKEKQTNLWGVFNVGLFALPFVFPLFLSDVWCFLGFCYRTLYWTCENKDFNPPECMLYVDHWR